MKNKNQIWEKIYKKKLKIIASAYKICEIVFYSLSKGRERERKWWEWRIEIKPIFIELFLSYTYIN